MEHSGLKIYAFMATLILSSSTALADLPWWLTSQTPPSVNAPYVPSTTYSIYTPPVQVSSSLPTPSAQPTSARSPRAQNRSQPIIPGQTTTTPVSPTQGLQPLSTTLTTIKPINTQNYYYSTGKTLTTWTCSTMDSSGNIILGGTYQDKQGNFHFAVAWVTPNTALTTTIKIIPAIDTGTNDKCTAILTDPSGNVLVAGSSTDTYGNTCFAVVRVTPKGVLDVTFGTNGGVRLAQTVAGGSNDQCYAVALDNNGNIILAGSSADSYGRNYFAAAEFTPAGILNALFGTGGTKLIRPTIAGGANDQCRTITVDSSNNVILSGTSFDTTGNSYFAIARINQ